MSLIPPLRVEGAAKHRTVLKAPVPGESSMYRARSFSRALRLAMSDVEYTMKERLTAGRNMILSSQERTACREVPEYG